MTSQELKSQPSSRVIFLPETVAAFAAASHGQIAAEQEMELLDRLPIGLSHEEIETFGRQQYNMAPSVHVFAPGVFENGQQDPSALERRGLSWLGEASLSRGDVQTAEFTVNVLRQKEGLRCSLAAYRLDRKIGNAKVY